MLRAIKSYALDTIVNISVQVFLLPGGYISLFMGSHGFWVWLMILVGYAVILAKMEQACERKNGADLKHYLLFVLLPANAVALIVSCIYFAVGLSAAYLHGNIIFGLVILLGSFAITLISLLCNILVFRRK